MTKTQKTISLIGIPMDLGQNHRGVDMGPSAIRYAGLGTRLSQLGYTLKDYGNLDVPVRFTLPDNNKAGLLAAISQACELSYQAAREAVSKKEIPVFLGGDHSLALGTVGGVTHAQRRGVIWFDAHGDYNTPRTSESGNVHGMALAVLLGNGDPELTEVGRPGPKLRPADVVLIGVRSLDAKEKNALKKSGITIYTMRDIDERGMGAVMHEALGKLSHLAGLHVSLDLDIIDPMTAPGVGTRCPGGINYREAQLAMEIIADSKRLTSLDLVEINPILDQYNRTAEVAVELTASLFGKSII